MKSNQSLPSSVPAPSGRVVSVCNQCVLDEWSRLAKSAYAADLNRIGHKFSMAATVPVGSAVCPKWFDTLQDIYRAWLVFGWVDAVPLFDAAFPEAPPAPASNWLPLVPPVGVRPSPSV